jgi:hypothetical protein
VREYELAVLQDVRRWEGIVELREAKSDENADDVRIVTEIEVDVLVNGEGGRVVVERHVNLGGGLDDDMVLHACEDFLDVALGR